MRRVEEKGCACRQAKRHVTACNNAKSMTDCPAEVKRALERMQLDIDTKQDEALISAWVDYLLREMGVEEKWQNPAKRLRSLASG